jgi:hypothetical protein
MQDFIAVIHVGIWQDVVTFIIVYWKENLPFVRQEIGN